jgi:starch phosphorylase
MKNPKVTHSYHIPFELPASLSALQVLAANYRWTWDHDTRDLFRAVDKGLWEASDHNPIAFLYSIPAERLDKLSKDRLFLERLQKCAKSLDDYLAERPWFDRTYPEEAGKTLVAYFCAEFGVSEGLPIYSGGLGILAGDHLKAASDLGIPLVAVGLLYAKGYFRQRLSQDGWQQEVYPQYDFYQMPLELIEDPNGEPVKVEVEFPDRTVSVQVWRAMVGRVALYLLDSNLMENMPLDQGITDTLYGGDEDMRIRQEMILGIGGMKALRAIGIRPTVCHMNEGHAAFLALERIRQFMVDQGCDFRTARQVIVAGNVFTTHTPVPAGFDLFQPAMLQKYVGKAVAATGLDFEKFLRLGRIEKDNPGEAFNMAVLAMENANHVNGVAKLHAKVSRAMFQSRWPDMMEDEVPVQAITNGIHTGTWVSHRMQTLLDEYLSPEWRRESADPEVWQGVFDIPDQDLWTVIENQRADLVRFVRKRLQHDLQGNSINRPEFGTINGILDNRILTIGFARRFATYKRGTLMLTDKERLKSLLFHSEHPVQIVIAGKSHPRDDAGKKFIQELVQFIRNEGARTRMVFLEDYDMRVARMLVQGVDVWLNNPRRPNEASGTSGMKVVPNGGINCSVLDGWWDEAYKPGVGFAIGDESNDSDEGHQDWLDSKSLYGLIEQEIAPRFYHRTDGGVPTDWMALVKNSMASLAPEFSTARMVGDYASKFYVPASKSYQKLLENDLGRAKAALVWRDRVESAWPKVRVRSVSNSDAVDGSLEITALIDLGSLSHDDVVVQALMGRIGPNRELLDAVPFDLVYKESEDGAAVFKGTVASSSPGNRGYTVRVMPDHPDVNVPSEMGLVRWES